MGIDHGLAGRDNDKSRRRRAKKAMKVKAIAQAALGKDRRVIFNEEARVEWLSGFEKRKKDRQKYGIAMQVLKDKKKNRDKGSEKKRAMKILLSQDEDIDHDQDKLLHQDEKKNITYNDSVTQNMFGSVVTVTVDDGIQNILDESFNNSSDSMNNTILTNLRKSNLKETSMTPGQKRQLEFSKAIKKAKSIIGKKKSMKHRKKNLPFKKSK